MTRTTLRRVAPAALVLILALPLPAAATGGLADASFAFGRAGGSILPYRVAIGRSGAVSASGAVRRSRLVSRVPIATMNGLLAHARRAGFFRMTLQTDCPRALPDVARFYITVSTLSRTRTVAVHGGCRTAFNRLLDALHRSVER